MKYVRVTAPSAYPFHPHSWCSEVVSISFNSVLVFARGSDDDLVWVDKNQVKEIDEREYLADRAARALGVEP